MAAEKDRLGDKLRQKEKAEEDRFFAEESRKKVEALRESQATPPVLGLCPRCGVALEQVVRQGVTIDTCDGCGGIWLDKGELEALSEHEAESWVSKWIRSVLEGSG